ncbi:hypothetical protein [Rhodoferax lacus]|uniref:hypothetical protein n=1 Tax=Rhodoferax lacus TaxID=2184758 RepID=UPI0011C16132|nr:hypothetical protein [Rhodoferax lacus]
MKVKCMLGHKAGQDSESVCKMMPFNEIFRRCEASIRVTCRSNLPQFIPYEFAVKVSSHTTRLTGIEGTGFSLRSESSVLVFFQTVVHQCISANLRSKSAYFELKI